MESPVDRDVVHRAIYDHFRRLWSDSQKQMLVPVGFGISAPTDDGTLGDVAEALLQNATPKAGDPQGNNTELVGNHKSAIPDESAADESGVDAGQLVPAPTAIFLEKLQRVLTVLEQEFPEVLQLPGENLEENSLSELELRFTAHPNLQQRVGSLESTLQGQIPPPLALDPSLPSLPNMPSVAPALAQPMMTSRLPPLNPGAIGMEIPDPVTLPPTPPLDAGVEAAVVTAAAAVAAAMPTDSNKKKRKTPPTSTLLDALHQQSIEPSSKKLKEQESEIKKIKTQLRRAKDKIQQLSRGKEAVAEDVIAKKVREGAEKKEKAMAAAVPFEQRYQELIHFQRGHGHCRVPCTSKENPGLARWVQTLRAAYKEKQKRGNRYYGQLTDERQRKLEEVGFEWSIQAPKATWEQRFEELKAYKEENGHCRVVRSYVKNPSLGEWCHRQRFLAHKNQLEEHKVKQLTELGFELWVRKQGKSWEDHFAKLLDFRRKHQHLKVPPPDTRTKIKQVLSTSCTASNTADATLGDTKEGPGDVDQGNNATSEKADAGPLNLNPATEEYKEDQAFRRWVVAQRDNYHLKYKKGIKSTLNHARVKKLDSIGFDFTREGGENDLRKMRRGELHHRNDPSIWKRRFAEVVEYKKRFGDCNIPKEWPENKQLGAWVSTQRKMYKALLAGERSSLTPERRSALESIGFTWILRPARTRPKILEIEGLQRTDVMF